MNELPRWGKGVRGIFAFRDGKCVPIDKPRRAVIPAPFVQQDTMDEIESMASPHREKFTSKSAYRRHLKALGFRESGGEHLKDTPLTKSKEEQEREEREWKDTIEQAYYDVKYDRIKFTEAEKEQHLRELRKWGKIKPPT